MKCTVTNYCHSEVKIKKVENPGSVAYRGIYFVLFGANVKYKNTCAHCTTKQIPLRRLADNYDNNRYNYNYSSCDTIMK